MKNIILATALVAVSASQASALSCIKPDVAIAFKKASDSDLSYVVLKGQFRFTPPADTAEPQAQTVETEFRGRLMTNAGFTQTVGAPITVNMNCAGSWCATIEPNVEYIAFVEQSETTLTFEVGPCYGLAFKEPDVDAVKRLENCAQGGACEPLSN